MQEVIDNFYNHYFKVIDDLDKYYQKEREKALKENKPYNLFERDKYIRVINELFKNGDYLNLWLKYLSYLRTRKAKIKDSDVVAKNFFKGIILPIMHKASVKQLNSSSDFLSKMKKALIEEEMYEELEIIEYYINIGSPEMNFPLLATSPIFEVVSKIQDYWEYMTEIDPR